MPGLLKDLVGLYQWIQDPDKAKRDNLEYNIQQNPDLLQKLSDNFNTTDPNQVMNTLGIRNARFGYNSSSATNLANQILSTPQSQQQQAINTEKLNTADVNNPAIANQSNVAMRGMTPEQKFDTTQKAYAGMRNGTANSPQYLSQDQQDLLQKLRTGQTSLDVSKGNADINLLNQEALSAGANADRTKAEIPGETAISEGRVKNQALATAADSALDLYYKNHPDARSRRMTSIFTDPTVDLDTRSAFMLSPKYSDTFKQQYTEDIEKQRLGLEAQRNNLQAQEMEEWLPRLKTANGLSAYSSTDFQGPQQGYIDLAFGRQTPEASQAADILAHGSVKTRTKLVDQYNSQFNFIQKLANAKNPDITNIGTQVSILNSMLPTLSAAGIDKPEIKYDLTPTSKLGLGQSILQATHMERDASKPRSLQTVDGGVPTVANFAQSADATQIDLLQRKATRYNQLKQANPSMPDDVIKARVEAEFSTKKK